MTQRPIPQPHDIRIADPPPDSKRRRRGLGVGALLLFALLAISYLVGRHRGRASFPQAVAGISFGRSSDEIRRLCRAKGFEIVEETRPTRKGEAFALTCVGLPEPVAYGSFTYVQVLFCGDVSCVIKLGAYDPDLYAPVRGSIAARFGEPRTDFTSVPSECEGEHLRRCLEEGRAQKLVVWTWTGGAGKIGSMIRLSHAASATGDYVFLSFSDARGSQLF